MVKQPAKFSVLQCGESTDSCTDYAKVNDYNDIQYHQKDKKFHRLTDNICDFELIKGSSVFE